MMNTIVDEKLISFKELEQKIFKYVCELAGNITQIILESYDNELAEKIALTVTESPYRITSDIISSTCGQSISAGGVWNLM